MAIAYMLIAFAGFVVTVQIIQKIRLSRHRGVSRPDFVNFFSVRGIPATVSGAVYDFYTSRVSVEGFSIAPADKLASLFSDEDDDLEDDGLTLLWRLGIAPRAREDLFGWETQISTIGDMVLWLDWARRRCLPPDESTSAVNGES